GENWFHHEVPSELFTNTVVTPYWAAWADIPAVVPSLDLLTYQIHMPLPSNAVPLPFRGRGVVRLWMWIGPTTLERAPWGPTIRIRPDLAVAGTVATKPSPLRTRSLEVSRARTPPEDLWVRARLNTTCIPCLLRLRPRKRSLPPGATVCGSLVHTTIGQQRTNVMRGFLECERALADAGRPAIRASASRARTLAARGLTTKSCKPH